MPQGSLNHVSLLVQRICRAADKDGQILLQVKSSTAHCCLLGWRICTRADLQKDEAREESVVLRV